MLGLTWPLGVGGRGRRLRILIRSIRGQRSSPTSQSGLWFPHLFWFLHPLPSLQDLTCLTPPALPCLHPVSRLDSASLSLPSPAVSDGCWGRQWVPRGKHESPLRNRSPHLRPGPEPQCPPSTLVLSFPPSLPSPRSPAGCPLPMTDGEPSRPGAWPPAPYSDGARVTCPLFAGSSPGRSPVPSPPGSPRTQESCAIAPLTPSQSLVRAGIGAVGGLSDGGSVCL